MEMTIQSKAQYYIEIAKLVKTVKQINQDLEVLEKNNFFSQCNSNLVYDILIQERLFAFQEALKMNPKGINADLKKILEDAQQEIKLNPILIIK